MREPTIPKIGAPASARDGFSRGGSARVGNAGTANVGSGNVSLDQPLTAIASYLPNDPATALAVEVLVSANDSPLHLAQAIRDYVEVRLGVNLESTLEAAAEAKRLKYRGGCAG